MSGILKSIGKLFNSVVVKPVKAIVGGIKDVAMAIWHTPILRYIAIAAAIYFTAGAASAYFGAAGAAGATGGASAAAGAGALGEGATVGGSILTTGTYVGAGSTATAFAGGTSFAAGAAVGAAGTAGAAGAIGAGAGASSVADTVAVGGLGASGSSIGAEQAATIASASVGANAGTGVAQQAGQLASSGMTDGGGAITGTPQGLAAWGAPASDTGAANSSVLTGGTYTGPGSLATTDGASASGQGLTSGASDAVAGGNNAAQGAQNAVLGPAGSTTQPVATAATSTEPQGLLGRIGSGLKHMWSGTPGVAADGTATTTGGMSGFEKVMLLKSAVDMASGWMRPVTQPQFSGRGPGGGGMGLGIHSTNNGFGLAYGGHEPAPSGVPSALLPPGGGGGMGMPGSAGNYAGSLSDAALSGRMGGMQIGNLGQAAANQSGVGGLVPQGAINYMGTP